MHNCCILQVIRFSVWDKDPTESELIGQVVEKYNKLDRMPGCATDVQWYNMYGAPEFKNDKLLSNLKKGALAVAKAAQQTFAGEIDWAVRTQIILIVVSSFLLLLRYHMAINVLQNG